MNIPKWRFMSWEEFCEMQSVPKMWQEINLKADTGISTENLDILLAWLKNPVKSLILSGGTGRGKTRALYGLIRELLTRIPKESFMFYKSKKLDDRLSYENKQYGTAEGFLEILKTVPFLFIDDFGVERDTARMERDYYEIIDGRYEAMLPTVISTNLNEEETQIHFGKRIFSRFKSYVWVYYDGEDIREILQ